MRTAGEKADLVFFYRSDLEFHKTLWELSANPYLVRALEAMVVPLFAFFIMRNSLESKDTLLLSCIQHQGLIDALRQGLPARPLMESTIQRFSEQSGAPTRMRRLASEIRGRSNEMWLAEDVIANGSHLITEVNHEVNGGVDFVRERSGFTPPYLALERRNPGSVVKTKVTRLGETL